MSEYQKDGGGSGTEIGYLIEVRCERAFVAWDIPGYVCTATPKAEFVIDHEWRSVPIASVPAPFGIAPRGLDHHNFRSDDLVCYETALALQYAVLARFRYQPGLECRITEVRYQFTFERSRRSAAPKKALLSSEKFEPLGVSP